MDICNHNVTNLPSSEELATKFFICFSWEKCMDMSGMQLCRINSLCGGDWSSLHWKISVGLSFVGNQRNVVQKLSSSRLSQQPKYQIKTQPKCPLNKINKAKFYAALLTI